MTAREKFQLGDRVRLTSRGDQMILRIRRYRPDIEPVVVGTVVGFGHRTSGQDVVRVLRDGIKAPVSYHMDFWEALR